MIFGGAGPNCASNSTAETALPVVRSRLVYIDPESWAHWKRASTFRDGTILVKELVSVGSKQAVSGNGYFQGEFIGL